jgi:hypothetical protein
MKPLRIELMKVRSRSNFEGFECRETYMFNERPLMLECVTLAKMIELMVKMLVNLARGTVLHEETAENTLAAHPQNLAETKASATRSQAITIMK